MEDKIVIVTGGANGIGFSICEALMQNRVKYIAIFDLAKPDRNQSGKDALLKLKKAYGPNRAEFFSCDVGNSTDFTENFKKVMRMHQKVDVLINNAGILKDTQPERMIDVNIKGTITGTLLALEHMGKQHGGRGCVVVNIASIVGLMTPTALPIYSSTKHAIVGFTRCMKDHFNNTGVRVVAVCPGATLTPLGSEVSENVLDIVTKEALDAITKDMPWQRPENVATAVIEIIKYGQSGAIWVAENNEPAYEIRLSESYSDMRVPIMKANML